MYHQALHLGNGKKVIITETGWPSKVESFKDSHPSLENVMKYFINTQLCSQEEDIDIFYFSSFDESWKGSAEPMEPEKHCGLFKTDRAPKQAMANVISKIAAV